MTWAVLFIQTLCWLVALYIIGALFLVICKASRIESLLFAPLVALTLFGILTLGTYLYKWSLLYIVLALFVLMVLFVFTRVIIEHGRLRNSVIQQRKMLSESIRSINLRLCVLLGLTVLINSLIVCFFLSGISLESIIGIQNYDNPFNLSVVRHILETGIASPIGAGSVMGAASAVYPSLWHALVALNCQVFLTSSVEGAWVICMLFMGPITSLSMVALVKLLFERVSSFSIFLAGVLPAIANHSIMNYMVFGSLFANLSGLALVPMALGWTLYLLKQLRVKACKIKVAGLCAASIVSIFALGLAHPSTVFIYFIFLVPLMVSRIQRNWGKVIVIVAAIVCWIILINSSLFFRTINCLDRIGSDIEMAVGIASRFGLDYSVLSTNYYLPICGFFFCVVLGIAIAKLLHKRFRNSWYLVGLFFILGQVFCAFFPENWFSIIATGFWYRDYPRFLTTLFFMGSCLVAYIPTLLGLFLNRFTIFSNKTLLPEALLTVVCLVCLVITFWGNGYRGILRTMSTTDAISQQEDVFMEQVAKIAGDDVVLNNANDNSVWMYSIYGINALVKGRPANQMSSMSDDLFILISGIDKIDDENAFGEQVRRAADALSLKYVVKMSNAPGTTMQFNELDQIQLQNYDAIASLTPETPGFDLVYELDGMQLYRVL